MAAADRGVLIVRFDLLQRSAVGLESWLVITGRLDSTEISSSIAKTRTLTSRPLEKGAFFVGLDQAIQDLNIVLSSPTSRVGLLDRDGDAAKPVFSRPCSCHVGASSAMASRLVAVLGGRTRR